MLEIDGGEGGGGILRTALSLAAVTGTPVTVENVRGSRPEPGLKPQHRAAVDVLAEFCGAEVEGTELGAETVVFEPGDERACDLEIDIGTAGSVTLLFDAVLPLAAAIDEPLTLTATGGTDVRWSPTLEYLRRVKLPLLARFGLEADLAVERRGFYPVGGGEARLTIRPSSLRPIRLAERSALEDVVVHSIASESLSDQEVAERQAERSLDLLDEAGYPVGVETEATVESPSPGSALLIRGVYPETLLGADDLGERGRPAEEVAESAVDAFDRAHRGPGAVDRYMADQVVAFLALAGGEVRIPAVTGHVATNLAVIRAFGFEVTVDERADGAILGGEPPVS